MTIYKLYLTLAILLTIFSGFFIAIYFNIFSSNELEKSLLAENWNKVLSILKDVNEKTQEINLRLIKGHACLATNRNNESLCLFMNTNSLQDLQQYLSWSEKFAAKNPNSPIACYFQGDALARNKKLTEAIEIFKKGLNIQKNHPMLLNAIGVAYVKSENYAYAKVSFNNAIKTFDFADGYANLGSLVMLQKTEKTKAYQYFEKSIQLSPNFSIALFGKACMGMLMNKEESEIFLAKAKETNAAFSEKIDENINKYLQYLIQKDTETLASNNSKAGTYMDKSFTSTPLSKHERDANNCFEKSEKWKNSKDLPGFVNKWMSNFWGNRGVEKLEKIQEIGGNQAVQNFANTSSVSYSTIEHHVNRVGDYNQSQHQLNKSISEVSKIVSIGTSFIPEPTQTTKAIAVTAKATEFTYGKMAEWNNKHHEFQKSFSSSNPGGVEIDTKKDVTYEDINWPFDAYFGLWY